MLSTAKQSKEQCNKDSSLAYYITPTRPFNEILQSVHSTTVPDLAAQTIPTFAHKRLELE